MNVKEAFLMYLKVEKRYSVNTIEAYNRDIDQYELFLNQKNTDVLKANAKDIKLWLVSLSKDEKETSSINRKLSAVRSMYRFLMKKQYIEINPTDKIISPKQQKKLPFFFSEIDMEKLFDVLEYSQDYEGIRDKTILEIFYATGMRCSELISLTISSIDFSNNVIRIIGKGNKERIVPMSIQLLQKIKDYLKEREANFGMITGTSYLFLTASGEPLYRRLVYRIVKKYIDKVSTVTKRSPHVIRHTFATHMLNHGADMSAIKSILGHSSLASTQVYVHTSMEQLKKTYNQAHPRA